ncbi:hypothetical protein [Leifsonia sp. LS-T14]|uniref:hypothetical protein n=1 Tax=unclassified Leifsonia TaxID=2663824 RepID=UPI0035A68E67
MVSLHTRARAPIALSLLAGAVLAAVLTGCAPQGDQAGTATPTSSTTRTSTSRATPTPTATPTETPVALPSPEASSVPTGNPAAKALAVQACEAVSGGFAADNVAAAAPLAAQAASADTGWQPLADKLEFIRTHPIDPETGEGPRATIDYSAAVAHDCFTQAGVTVSQD